MTSLVHCLEGDEYNFCLCGMKLADCLTQI